MLIKSVKDELEFRDDMVLIRRKGAGNFLAVGMNGERSIHTSSITSMQMKLGGWTPGFIQFSYAGGKQFNGGLMEATQDPDAFIFQKQLNDEVTKFKSLVEQSMRAGRERPIAAAQTSTSVADEIRKLADLKNDGVLTQEEFDAAKMKLLSSAK